MRDYLIRSASRASIRWLRIFGTERWNKCRGESRVLIEPRSGDRFRHGRKGLLPKRRGPQFSPPLRGGVDATSIKYREASFMERTGWCSNSQNFVEVEHHPVCAS